MTGSYIGALFSCQDYNILDSGFATELKNEEIHEPAKKQGPDNHAQE